ncbi:MAG TPA: FHA domain-containing protein [Gemmataceae bacterium]|jgi:hypothetical protein|nr:FHA domain-containing protein [Gemmataceae bacterium]
MSLLLRIYFNAVFGALGGLVGWLLFGAFGEKNSAAEYQWFQQLIGGALVGGSIGYLVVSVDAMRDRSLLRFCRLASYGVVLGAVGGALGMWAGDQVNYLLVGRLAADPERRETALRLAGTVLARGLGWMFLGVAVGVSEGVAARSLGKLSYGTAGGALGGLLGGAFFGLLLEASEKDASSYVWGQAVGLAILGACIGSLSALVQGVFQPASVKVVRGWQEGREYALLKSDSVLGRDERADIALFRDMKVEKRHAVIRRQASGFVLLNNHAPPEQTRVNGETVPQVARLHDGDRIQLGNVVLRFQARAAVVKRRWRGENRG